MSWTCPGHYKVHVHGRDSPGRPVHGHCPVPLPALPCAAHTLQLSVEKELDIVRHLVLRVKRLIDFFNVSPKQMEQLFIAQQDLKFKKCLSTIGDVSTRWNSSYYAWERLLQLKWAIIYLPSRLQSDENAAIRNRDWNRF